MINIIFGGFARGGSSIVASKRHIQLLNNMHLIEKMVITMPHITFTDEDFKAPDLNQDDPIVITIEIVDYRVRKVLVDQGRSVNILY